MSPSLFVVHVPLARGGAGRRSCRSFTLDATTSIALVAVLGTTISPYLFFWQAAQEVEEQRDARRASR